MHRYTVIIVVGLAVALGFYNQAEGKAASPTWSGMVLLDPICSGCGDRHTNNINPSLPSGISIAITPTQASDGQCKVENEVDCVEDYSCVVGVGMVLANTSGSSYAWTAKHYPPGSTTGTVISAGIVPSGGDEPVYQQVSNQKPSCGGKIVISFVQGTTDLGNYTMECLVCDWSPE